MEMAQAKDLAREIIIQGERALSDEQEKPAFLVTIAPETLSQMLKNGDGVIVLRTDNLQRDFILNPSSNGQIDSWIKAVALRPEHTSKLGRVDIPLNQYKTPSGEIVRISDEFVALESGARAELGADEIFLVFRPSRGIEHDMTVRSLGFAKVYEIDLAQGKGTLIEGDLTWQSGRARYFVTSITQGRAVHPIIDPDRLIAAN